jgi:hypothetical protein
MDECVYGVDCPSVDGAQRNVKIVSRRNDATEDSLER